jgi:hypothetical protein
VGLVLVVLGVTAAGLTITIQSGHRDSAMLFVGLPALLALAIVLTPPARSAHGLTFKSLSVALLLSAVMLHEGAICVLFAAPLVYAVGHGVTAILKYRHKGTFAVVPLALLLGLEGLSPGLRVIPDQVVTATRTVALAPAEVARLVAAGPRVAATRPSLLLANMPLPAHIGGSGIDPGDRWVFHFDGDNHGPGGVLVTEVAEHTSAGTGARVLFRTISDTSIVARWLQWTSASLEWHPVNTGTSVTLTVHFTRGLDPSWYFGPLEDAIVESASGYLLDTLGLTQP